MQPSSRRLIGLLEYIVVLFIVLDFNTVYSRTVNVNYHLTEITSVLLLILLLVRWNTYGFKLKSMQYWTNYHIIYYIFALLLLFTSVGNEQRFSYVMRFLIILPMLNLLFVAYAEKKNIMSLFEKYSLIMTVLAAISLIFWLFGSQLNIIHPTGRILAHWGSDYFYPSYFGLYVERQGEHFLSFYGLRNQGIFCEAPMHSFALVIAIAYNAFLRDEHNGIQTRKQANHGRIRQIILVITLLTTITTTGMIVLLLIIGLTYLIKRPRDKAAIALKWLISIILLAVITYLAINIFIMKATSKSWIIRLDDFQAGFRGWLHSPLYGSGYGTYAGIDPYRASFRFIGNETPSFSNSLLLILAQGGIIYFMMYIVPVVKGIRAALENKDYKFIAFVIVFLVEFTFTIITNSILLLLLIAMFYGTSIEQLEFGGINADIAPVVNNKQVARFVWKPPIWLDEDDGKATGIREENVSFGVLGTLIRRSVARPADLFRIMEQNDPNVPEHFAEKRMEAERAAYAKLGARMGLADIYEELLPLYGARTNDLMALEIQYEIAGCRPVADNIDLVNLCMEHDKNVFLIADSYLPSSVLRRMLDVCGVYHYDRLYVSCEEGACKADGSLFWKVLADQEIRPHELRHIGSDRQGDIEEPWRVGVHVKRGKKKELSAVEKELPEDIALYERTLQACIRNCADDLDSDDARLGCETFGPLLAGFAAWLREQLRMDGIQDVYFLAGDGSIMKQVFDALEDDSFRTHSLYFPAQTADQDHEALVAYLRACGMQGRVALVDTGRVAVQKTLESLIAESKLNIQVKGYYVGLNADTENMQAAGYLYEPGQGKETQEKLSPVMAIFDTVFHAQHGPVCRITMRDGQPVPELDAYEYASDEGRICDEIAILRAYQAGALTLVREMNEAFPGGVPQIPGEAALLPLLRMGTNPTRQEAELWGDFRVFRHGKATMMARPKRMGYYLLHPGQLKRDYAASPWKIGFLRRLIRLPLAYDKIVKNR